MICTTCAKGGGHDVRDNIKHKIRGEHDISNSNNGELTPGEKSRGAWHPQMTCRTCANEGGHDIHDNIKHKIRGEHDVRNSNNGELTPGKKQGGMASANYTHDV